MRNTDNSPVLKVKTHLKAGECCWESFKQAQRSGSQSDWNNFWNCCNKDGKCTYRGGGYAYNPGYPTGGSPIVVRHS
jgi:hypothetical protein